MNFYDRETMEFVRESETRLKGMEFRIHRAGNGTVSPGITPESCIRLPSVDCRGKCSCSGSTTPIFSGTG